MDSGAKNALGELSRGFDAAKGESSTAVSKPPGSGLLPLPGAFSVGNAPIFSAHATPSRPENVYLDQAAQQVRLRQRSWRLTSVVDGDALR